MGITSCKDFLNPESPSETTPDFVFSDPQNIRFALNNIYEKWRKDGSVHSNGLYYDMLIGGSDSERHPEEYISQARHIPESMYGYDTNLNFIGPDGHSLETYSGSGAWTSLYNIISAANALTGAVKETATYAEMMASSEPTLTGQLYGEAVAMRATAYYELMRFIGDVPLQLVAGAEAGGVNSRDSIAEFLLQDLIAIEPHMYRAGESTEIDKTYMTRGYVQGLIGRIAMLEAGYQTRRDDLGPNFYVDLEGNVVSFEKTIETTYGSKKCFYGRRTDYRKFLEIAEKYLGALVDNPGTQTGLQTTDPRAKGAAGQEFGNPFQYVFQQMNDLDIAFENVYEIPESWGVQTERPYAFGRPSNGGNKGAYPNKAYGQSRFHAVFYYGDYDNNDMRRDVTATVTGSAGTGAEALLKFIPGNTTNAGIANNKWDDNRLKNPYMPERRKSGVHTPYMRFSDMVLLLAEAKALLGKDADAKRYVKMIHDRAFGANSDVDAFIAKQESMLDAVLMERKLELAGEGARRYDLIRTGKLFSEMKKFHEVTGAMMAGLRKQGFYEFKNGNQIPAYIWTKVVDAKSQYGHRLTTQCPAGKEDDPVLFPGWRGQNDDWLGLGKAQGSSESAYTAGNMTNLAIKGLFKYIDPESAEAKALEADGYKKTDWGADVLANEKEYNDYVLNGVIEGKVPVYFVPIGINQLKTNKLLINGYGFPDK